MADNRKSTAASFIDKVFVVKNKGRKTSRGTRGRKTVDVANGVVMRNKKIKLKNAKFMYFMFFLLKFINNKQIKNTT